MPEEKRKINAWIPVSLYNKLESAGYDNITQALIKALESFREDTQEDITGYIQDIEGYKQDIEGYKQDLSRIQKDLDKQNQDIIGYIQDIRILQTRSEEQERHISFLKEAMEKAGQREEDLKQIHNNYMLQIQSLINARALMPSGSTEGEKEERVFEATQDSPTIKESPDTEPEKGHIEKICKYCGEPFYTDNIQKEYCSKDHKDKAYNEKRKQERENRKNEELNLKKKG